MSSASQVLMALKKSRSERMERKDRKEEKFSSVDIRQKVLPIYLFPQKNLCNFEQLRWNVMIKNALNLQY